MYGLDSHEWRSDYHPADRINELEAERDKALALAKATMERGMEIERQYAELKANTADVIKGVNEACDSAIYELEARVKELEAALDQMVNGTKLGEFNHDDDCLQSIAGRLPIGCYGVKQLLNHSLVAQAALKKEKP
jgi:hypothetical protein